MSVLSIPNVFVQGTTINSAPFNTNFSAVQTAVNNVDNSNVGASGFFASQLLPTTLGQATFGGAIGYLHLAPSASTTPLTVSGVAGQSADIFDVTLTSAGTNALRVTAAGALQVGSAAATAAGDIGAARTASTGLIVLGSTLATAGTIDYGASTAATFSMKNGAGGFVLLNVGTLLAGPATPPIVSPGDIAASRSVSTGIVKFGGSTSSGGIDWNILTANQISLSLGTGAFAPFSAGAYTNASDVSLKKNVAGITDSLALISQLKPSSFVWIEDDSNDIGFVAQDIAAIMPDAITTFANGTLGYKPVAILAHLVSAFQQYVADHP